MTLVNMCTIMYISNIITTKKEDLLWQLFIADFAFTAMKGAAYITVQINAVITAAAQYLPMQKNVVLITREDNLILRGWRFNFANLA